MLLKTKLFFALGSLGVVGGTGAGVYYLKSTSSDETVPEKQPASVEIVPEVDSAPESEDGAANDGNPKGTDPQPQKEASA